MGTPIELDYRVGGVWAQKDLIAPFSFPVHRDEREYQKDVAAARATVYPVFERRSSVEEMHVRQLDTLFSRIGDVLAIWEGESPVPSDSLALSAGLAGIEIPFSENEWMRLVRVKSEGRLGAIREQTLLIAQALWASGILDRAKSAISRSEIAVRVGKEESIIRTEVLYDSDEAMKFLEARLRTEYPGRDDLVGIAYKIGALHIRPNIIFSERGTADAIAAAVEAVPRTTGFVQEDERIVSKHERITNETWLKLESFRKARADRKGEESLPLQFAGVALHVLVVLVLFSIYLALFRKRIFANNSRLILIGLLILVQGILAYVAREINTDAPVEYLVVVPTASMLLAIVFDSRVAFYGTVIIAFLIGGIRGNDYSITLAALVAGALSVYTVRDIRNRSQIFRSMGFIFLGYAAAILALALERFAPVNAVVFQLSFALINAMVSPVLTYGLLIFFERVFKVTTDLTLIELSHFNHPLLRQLAEKAPGTYHHSMSMAGLAEAAAAAIGANETLARVGACFHDIGKIVKPTYFVENQRGSRNRHEKLAPRMSSLILQAHVKEGMALAEQHRLPEEVIEFIPMHHGTTRIEYFYNKALRVASNSDDETKVDEVNEQDYRYSGPKPQTKETGIVMLADAIEARARVLEDPLPQRLEGVIDEVIRGRFTEGELDECPLTLKDLTKIREAFLKVLVGAYHGRVQYPENAQGRKSPVSQRESPDAVPLSRDAGGL
jgi:hypothetical protein